MYDRAYGERELTFEASGALMRASLVMRDRETDSWWSIMTSSAVGGPLEGSELVELAVSEKATWADWRARHPHTLVLSIEGREHEPRDGYEEYWRSQTTFRNLVITDRRLPPKEPVFSFWLGGRPYAAAHREFEGGRVFSLDDEGAARVFLYRPPGAPLHASSRALRIPPGVETGDAAGRELVERLERDGAGALEGFDTYWYTWIAIQEDSRLLGR